MTKQFTLNDYLAKDSQFKIGIEFEKSDEEIKEILKDDNVGRQWLEGYPFEGYISLNVEDTELSDTSLLVYPAIHLSWLKFYAKQISGDTKNSIYNHMYPRHSDVLSIFYRHINNKVQIRYVASQGERIFHIEKEPFIHSINDAVDVFLNKAGIYANTKPVLHYYTDTA